MMLQVPSTDTEEIESSIANATLNHLETRTMPELAMTITDRI